MKLAQFIPLFVVLTASIRLEASSEDLTIQPRGENSRWDYTSYFFEGDQAVASGTARERVIEVKEIAGVVVYRVELLTDWRGFFERLKAVPLDPDSFSYFWEYNSEKGSHNFSEYYDDPIPPTSLEDFALTLPYPTEEGFRYEADGVPYEVLSIDREITVPGGTFKTVVYQLTDEVSDDPSASTRERYFMTPGVGLVRWEMDVLTESGDWILDSRDDLFSYSI